jgi:Coenzyme PQQ synthesis protein D (PqqD)
MSDMRLALSPSPWVRDIQTDDGAALLDIQQGICFSMNPVGARIWNMLNRQCSLDQITNSIASDFGIPSDRVQADAVEFMRTLEQRGLLLPVIPATDQ